MSFEDVKAVAAIVLIFVVLPVVLLKAKDRGRLKTAFGVLAILAGLGLAAALVDRHFLGNARAWDLAGGIGAASVPVLLFLGGRWILHGGPGIEHVPPGFTCPELEASVDKAQATLPWFIGQVERNVDGAFVRFALKTPGGMTEHIWGYVHSHRDGVFNVSLANVPFDPDASAQGRRDVPRAEVEDWQIMLPDGRIRGAYSLRALFEHFEAKGRLTHRMREQRRQLVDETDDARA